MTTENRSPSCPALDAQTFATRFTARSAHARALAAVVNSAALDHPSQRCTITRTTGGVYRTLYQPSELVRYLQIRLTVARVGTYTAGHGVRITLSVTDGAVTVSTTPQIHAELDASPATTEYGGGLVSARLGEMGAARWYLDVRGLVAAGLNASAVWTLKWSITCDATAAVEMLQVEEVTRFSVDTADGGGALIGDYLTRRAIKGGARAVERLEATARRGYLYSLRAYHHVAAPEAAPATISGSTSFVSVPSPWADGAGAEAEWEVRPRRIKTTSDECPIRFGCWYATAGAFGATLRLLTGASGSPFDLTLPGTSGAIALVTTGAGFLDTSASPMRDTLRWQAKVGNVAEDLDLFTLWAVDAPAF